MFGFQRRFLGYVLILAVSAFLDSDVHAMDLSKPLPKLSAKELLWLNSSQFHEDFDKGIHGDCTSLTTRLEKAVQNEEAEYAARVVLGEMYDRAICVPFDPAKAFKNFKRAADMGGPYYYALVGWKYYYRHGVEQSETKANEAFKLLLIRTAFSKESKNYTQFQKILRDRKMPPPLKAGIAWLIETTKTEAKAISFARSLFDGSGKYYDGTPLPVDKIAARNILSPLAFHNPQAGYVLGMAQLGSSYEGHMYLEQAAICGSQKAALQILDDMLNERHGYKNISFITYAWYLLGQEKGYEGVQKYVGQIQTSSYMKSYAHSHLSFLKKREKQCE